LMSRYAASAREALVRAYTLALKALLIVSVPFAVGTTLLADELVLLVGGPDYLPHSATALRILIWFLPFSYVNSVTQYVLIAVERQRFLTVAFVVGAGFTFGRRRSGNIELLRQFGALHGFGVEVVEPIELDGERVSSTRVREALVTGQMDRVRRLLGRDFRMSGRVIRGRRLGRTLGYATANMRLHRRVSPVSGVFAVRVHGAGEGPLPGVASVGVRPTLGGGEPLLEAHVFDFGGDLYGRYLQVDFVEKLRDEVRFPSVDAMILRIHADASAARQILTAG